VTSYNWHCSQ